MNISFFIAKRLFKNQQGSSKYSRPIVIISILTIALCIAVMLLSVSILRGFQDKIQEKVIGFGSHIQVKALNSNYSFESTPFVLEDSIIKELRSHPFVKNVQAFATKPGIIQSNRDTVEVDGELKINRNIKGIIFKGVDENFDFDFLKERLVEGEIFQPNSKKAVNKIIVSKFIADKLNLKINDRVNTYFLKKENLLTRKFTICGIYQTGIEEFDNEVVFIDLGKIQKLSNWGINSQLFLEPKCYQNRWRIKVNSQGGNGKYAYKWQDNYSLRNSRIICLPEDTVIQVVVNDINQDYWETEDSILLASIPDTSWMEIKNYNSNCECDFTEELEIEVKEDGYTHYLKNGKTIVKTKWHNTGGSQKYYYGGLEIALKDFEHLDSMANFTFDALPFDLEIQKINEQYPNIFNWLDILNVNVVIILVLMLFVSIVNISAVILVKIIEQTNTIGILKSFGAKNFVISKIFIYNGGLIVFTGMILGNIITFLIIFLQQKYSIIKLTQESYYLKEVPFDINILYFLLINLGTLLITTFLLVIPSLYISRISPTKSIRFD